MGELLYRAAHSSEFWTYYLGFGTFLWLVVLAQICAMNDAFMNGVVRVPDGVDEKGNPKFRIQNWWERVNIFRFSVNLIKREFQRSGFWLGLLTAVVLLTLPATWALILVFGIVDMIYRKIKEEFMRR